MGDETVGIFTEIIHSLADCFFTPTDITHGLDDQAVVCVFPEPVIECGCTFAVGMTHSAFSLPGGTGSLSVIALCSGR